jgi:hypothetical protein
MTPVPTTAWLRKDSPFAAIFPDGCPVQGPIESAGRFDGEVEGFYRCDFLRCTPKQRDDVAARVASASGSPIVDVLAHWQHEGFLPLRARHVESFSFDGRLML